MASGRFSVHLARSKKDLAAAQALRFEVFFDEFKAKALTDQHSAGLDSDKFDDFCEHLLVVDNEQDKKVIATTRLLLSSQKPADLSYIAQEEFSIPLLDAVQDNCMEVGRSCVHKDYRDGKAIQFLWRGITKLIFDNDIRYLFGCASFHSTDIDEIAYELAYLHHYHMDPAVHVARALDYQSMDSMPKGEIDPDKATALLPPLIKAYLSLGGVVGNGVALDPDFKTLDILITVDVSKVPDQYHRFYRKQADRLSFDPLFI
ncbi:GNAT family N-acyltransferase [Thalassospira sp.]|uniref:GNAT family N-acetyltransferase n=1 Tax=Thalassospira sp. TaxID=1912094 RepID=UPI001B138921|nr:GNAT family N-acyltransferase [Thalassospira sp.]MBO6807394.1 GNAT family N-acetyltransferase [Thalassospira sp.]MBO6842417.1 GNAT family N-acetyltransferase [Thalassospira sp.]